MSPDLYLDNIVIECQQTILLLQLYIINKASCSAIFYPATRPSILLDGYQGHPPFLPVAWDRPAATEPESETVYTRHTFIHSTFVDSRRQCKMRLKPENRKDPIREHRINNTG
jgi:hypothetical protein